MMKIKPLWSDSLGAKSFSVYIQIDGKRIIIDPGVAILQRSYPGDRSLHVKWYEEAYEVIKSYLVKSEYIIVTHYHHDHYLWRDEDIYLYEGKTLLVKDLNKYINDSQWKRGRIFIESYSRKILGSDLKSLLTTPQKKIFRDLVKDYKIALSKDFGEYNERRRELLKKGGEWFRERVEHWRNSEWIREIRNGENKVIFIDGKSIRLNGDVKIYFSPPLYHGIEYSRTGWVIGLVLDSLGRRILYSSDIQGPVIEDYAKWIIETDPEIIFLDGPPTYLIPYMFNLINFRRTIENIKWIIRESRSLKIVIYDHHLTRDIDFYRKTKEVFNYGREYGVEIMDVATYLGLEPAYERIRRTL